MIMLISFKKLLALSHCIENEKRDIFEKIKSFHESQ